MGHPVFPGLMGHPVFPGLVGHPVLLGLVGHPVFPGLVGHPVYQIYTYPWNISGWIYWVSCIPAAGHVGQRRVGITRWRF